MFKPVGHTRAVLIGLLFAMVGFSCALATNQGVCTSLHQPGVTPRIVGTSPLRFTNPIVPSDNYGNGDLDLGDVALDSSLVRYARATGGVRPYTFAAGNANPTITSALTGGSATLSVLSTGTVLGLMGTVAQNPVRFTVMVTDSLGTQPHQVTNVFRLTLDNSGVFRFGANSLSDGIQFQPYFDVLPVLNGLAPLTFSVSNVSLNGTATKNGVLEDVGLYLGTSDGMVFGKPFVSGTLVFTAKCTDSQGNQAANRVQTAMAQTITINLIANAVVASDIIATAISIKAGTVGNDSVRYAGILNLGGKTVSALAGKAVQLKIAGYTTPNTSATPALLDSKGKIAQPVKQKNAAMKAAPVLKGSINSKGQFKITVNKDALGATLGTLTTGQKGLAVFVQIGDVVASSQFLVFNVTTSNGLSALTYKLSGTSDLGGEFMVVGVKGKDARGGKNGITTVAADAWKASIIAIPGGGTATFGSPAYASIGIGDYSDPLLTVSEANGSLQSTDNRRTSKTANVTKLIMNANSGKGSLVTGSLPAALTNIMTAATASAVATNTFALNITLLLNSGNTPAKEGEAAKPIFPNKNTWSSNPPK